MVKKYCSWFDSVLKTNPRTYEVEYLNGETTTWSIYEKEFVLRDYKWVIIQKQIAALDIKSK